jgi:hypothetical protein
MSQTRIHDCCRAECQCEKLEKKIFCGKIYPDNGNDGQGTRRRNPRDGEYNANLLVPNIPTENEYSLDSEYCNTGDNQ